jgi:hypothetical protein
MKSSLRPWIYVASCCIVCLTLGCANYTKSKIPFSEEQLKEKNDAVVYVYRLKSMIGALVGWKVYIDKKVVGVLYQGAYMPLHLQPGDHLIDIGEPGAGELNTVQAINAEGAGNLRKFSIKEGEVLYIRSEGPYVSAVPKEKAMAELPTMKLDMGK